MNQATPPVFGMVAMGEMGAGIASRLVARGARVLTSLAGRSDASFTRAQMAGAECVDDYELVGRADLLLSVVPPHVALATSERYLPILQKSRRRPCYVDLNAISPPTLREMAAAFERLDLPFLDGSIIGAPPDANKGMGPRIYLSGRIDRTAELLGRYGLDAIRPSDRAGDASALKMSYAGITKGFQAIGTAMALGASKNGVGDALRAELQASQPMLFAWLRGQLPRMPAKAYRWDGEMREIARFLEPEPGSAAMLAGAADLYAAIARASADGQQPEMLDIIAAFAKELPK